MWQRMVGVRQCKWPELELDLLMDYGYRTQLGCPDGSGGGRGQGKCKHGRIYCTQTKRIVLPEPVTIIGVFPHTVF